MNNQLEEWKACEGIVGLQVSSHGNLRLHGEHLAHYNQDGYRRTSIDSKYHFVHRLVADVFCKKSEGCNIVNHIDGRRDNNYYTNLEWTTVKGNAIHAATNNMLADGERHTRTELTESMVLTIDALLREGVGNGEIADRCGVSREVVSKIKAGRTWTKVTGRTLAPIVRRNAVGKSKLNGEQVVQIRAQVAAGESIRSIAANYNLSHTTLVAIINGTTWLT